MLYVTYTLNVHGRLDGWGKTLPGIVLLLEDGKAIFIFIFFVLGFADGFEVGVYARSVPVYCKFLTAGGASTNHRIQAV